MLACRLIRYLATGIYTAINSDTVEMELSTALGIMPLSLAFYPESREVFGEEFEAA